MCIKSSINNVTGKLNQTHATRYLIRAKGKVTETFRIK